MSYPTATPFCTNSALRTPSRSAFLWISDDSRLGGGMKRFASTSAKTLWLPRLAILSECRMPSRPCDQASRPNPPEARPDDPWSARSAYGNRLGQRGIGPLKGTSQHRPPLNVRSAPVASPAAPKCQLQSSVTIEVLPTWGSIRKRYSLVQPISPGSGIHQSRLPANPKLEKR